MPRLESASVVVTGGTGAVGRAIARHFLEAGVPRLGLIGRDTGRGEAAADELRSAHPDATVVFAAADVNLPVEAGRVIDELAARLDGIDVLVNGTTGSYSPQLLHDTDPEAISGIIQAQLLGPLNTSRAVLPLLRERGGGAIVNIASDAAKYPTPGETIIGAAMAAIVMFSRTLAAEAKRDGVRVNAVTPSLIADSGGYERVMGEPFSAKLFQKATALASLGVADPDDIAALVVFLAGPGSRRITGQVVSPNGGIST